jgi:hypothetical protein
MVKYTSKHLFTQLQKKDEGAIFQGGSLGRTLGEWPGGGRLGAQGEGSMGRKRVYLFSEPFMTTHACVEKSMGEILNRFSLPGSRRTGQFGRVNMKLITKAEEIPGPPLILGKGNPVSGLQCVPQTGPGILDLRQSRVDPLKIAEDHRIDDGSEG